MRTRIIQSNMVHGELAPTLHGRIDTELYTGGVKEATNMVIMPHGGLRRRGGFQKITDSYLSATTDVRCESFVFSRTESYLLVFTNNSVKVYYEGALQATVVTTYTSAELSDIDLIQSADTVIITHEDHPPAKLVRGASHTSWTLSDITLLNIPTFDWTGTPEPVWSATRGYPRTCTFHNGRLWFGGSKSKVSSVWGSVAGDLFNFNVGTGLDNEAIFDTIDTNAYNEINGIVSAGSLQVFTLSQEFYNLSTQVITPTNSAWASYSTLGCRRIRPLFLNGATLFIDASKRTLRQVSYNDGEQTYTPINASLKSSHLLTDVVAIDMIKGTTTDFSDLVFIVNADGTVAVFNTLRNEGISGWTKWTTDGLVKDVAVVDKAVYFIIERGGNLYIELLTEGTYSDHNTLVQGVPKVINNITFGLDNITFNGDNIVYQDPTTGTPVTSVTTDIKEALAYSQYWRVVADNSVLDSSLPTSDGTDLNHFDLPRDSYNVEIGLDYDVAVTTLPLNAPTKKDGDIVDLRKRVNRVILRLHDSLGVKVQDIIMNDRKFIVSLDQTPVPFTGIKELYLLGYGRLVEVEVSQSDPLPFTLLGIDAEVEF